MLAPMTTVVWFKRDLRMADHAPLAAAVRAGGPVLALFVVEPEWLADETFDAQHLVFVLDALARLRHDLAVRGLVLHVCHGSLLTVLQAWHQQHGLQRLFSHEETGPGWTYQRDLAVARWCRAHGVAWQEWPQTGVVRRLRNRSGWAGHWQARMDTPQAVAVLRGHSLLPPPGADLPTAAQLGVHGRSRPVPAAGEAAAHRVLDSFLGSRSAAYSKALSSPLSAASGCSRLSAHLAWGTVSLRQVHQATEARIEQLLGQTEPAAQQHARALRAFSGRLRWHCHFMQKLEDEPAIEWRNFSRAHDGLRPGDTAGGGPPLTEEDQARLAAWCEGRTGFPMVDACMRSLRATGWLNFRMRAMLVSFAAYHLWLHWRAPGLFLAQQFLDFEAGIHWSQMQMQSGTTGINTLRIYSPAKQSADHDPAGLFVRRWVPEWGTPAYPSPIVDERQALARAKDVLYGLRRGTQARAEADAIQQRHGSRKAGLSASGTPPRTAPRHQATRVDTRQPDLFDDESASP